MEPKSLRIVFMGTPEFASTSLRRLVEEGYNVVTVVTTPDKPAGRGQKMHQSDVKLTALELGLPILQPEKLRHPNSFGSDTFFEEHDLYIIREVSVTELIERFDSTTLFYLGIGVINLVDVVNDVRKLFE